MTATVSPEVAIAQALPAVERAELVRRFVAVNPRWQGAEAADVIGELYNGDAYLPQREAFYAAHGGELPDGPLTGHATVALCAIGRELTVAAVQELLDEARAASELVPVRVDDLLCILTCVGAEEKQILEPRYRRLRDAALRAKGLVDS